MNERQNPTTGFPGTDDQLRLAMIKEGRGTPEEWGRCQHINWCAHLGVVCTTCREENLDLAALERMSFPRDGSGRRLPQIDHRIPVVWEKDENSNG